MGRKRIQDDSFHAWTWMRRILSKVPNLMDAHACWEWQGAKNNFGYGVIRYCGKSIRVHRFVFEFVHGKIDDDTNILHRCDNPACFNPDHLFSGTQKDNIHDAAEKGRIRVPRLRGEQHGKAKLTDDQIIEIRKRHINGERQYVLAAEYGVTQSLISLSILRKIRDWL